MGSKVEIINVGIQKKERIIIVKKSSHERDRIGTKSEVVIDGDQD